MSLDALSVLEGASSGMLAQKTLDTVSPDKTNEDIVNAVRSVEACIIDVHNLLFNHLASLLSPERRINVTLYKSGKGPSFIPQLDTLLYTRILCGVNTTLSVESSIGTFSPPAITAGQWIPLDFPDRTAIYLDSSATTDSQTVFIRYTNVPPQN